MNNLTGTISGIGAYLPPQRVSSEDLMREANTEKFGVPFGFLGRVTGIRERRFSEQDQLPSDMAIEASRIAIADVGIDPLEIDCVLFCGIDRDFAEPATAHIVANAIGAHNAGNCFDISNACHGIMSGVSVANAYISSGMAEHVLVCTGEKPSNVALDVTRQIRLSKSKEAFKNLIGALTLGDSGGAFVISKSDSGRGFKTLDFSAKGEFAHYCYIKYEQDGVKFNMLMDKICSLGVNMHKSMIENTYDKLQWSPESISMVYCHQTGAKPHEQMAKLARQPLHKVPATYQDYGNLTSSTIVTTMYLFRPSPEQRILILSAGSGVIVGQGGLVFGE